MPQPNRAQLARQPYPYTDVPEELNSMNVRGEYILPGSKRNFIDNPIDLPANPVNIFSSYNQGNINPDETVSGRFYGPDAGRATDLLKLGVAKPTTLSEKLKNNMRAAGGKK